MTTTPTPASQPSVPREMRVDKADPVRARLCSTCEHEAAPDNVRPCNCCWNPLGDMYRRRVVPIASAEQPSPARSDKDFPSPSAQDANMISAFEREMANDPEAYSRPGEVVYTVTQKEMLRFAKGIAAQESAPSGEGCAECGLGCAPGNCIYFPAPRGGDLATDIESLRPYAGTLHIADRDSYVVGFAKAVEQAAALARRATSERSEEKPAGTTAAPSSDAEKVMRDLLYWAENTRCPHEETHRGGAIWEICDACGEKWADDEGGKPPSITPAPLQAAHDWLAERATAGNAAPTECGYCEGGKGAHDDGYWVKCPLCKGSGTVTPAATAAPGDLPSNDDVYAEVCRQRGTGNRYVSTNAVNDVMAAVRRLASNAGAAWEREKFVAACRRALVSLAHAAEKHGIYQTDYERFAAAVEAFAPSNPPAGATQGQTK